jgi:hypothetical protein
MMVWQPVRLAGLGLALAISLAAFATLAWHQEWKKTPLSVLLGTILIYLLLG